jgi:uncharacterized membrane protein YccC
MVIGVGVILALLVIGAVIAAWRLWRDPRVVRRFAEVAVELHALRRARELDQLRSEIRRDGRRLRRELLEEFRRADDA